MEFKFKKILMVMSTTGMLCSAYNIANAAAFQLWEQDGASVGDYHAGRAVTDDASTSYYNPAGLVRIHNQQLIVAADPILTDFKFRGTINVIAPVTPSGNQNVIAQGGNFNLVPSLHYAAPYNDRIYFGFSIVSPFGLETNYGLNTAARYAANKTALTIIDIAPSVGIKINDKWSLGAGLDAEHARAEFDLVGTTTAFPLGVFDTASENVGRSWAYGFHLGALFQPNETTRIGFTYHSKVVHHSHGESKFIGPLATALGVKTSTNLKADIDLPATTTLSIFKTLNHTWDFMGTIAYTQWSVLQNIVLMNVAGVDSTGAGSETVTVIVPEHYRNTWNVSVGANYHLNEQWLFRSGIGFDETPANDTDRNLQLPDSDRIAVALGTHYQMTKAVGIDLGWTHFFVMNTFIHNVHQVVGAQQTYTNGAINAGADVLGLEVTWDIS